MLQCVAVCCRVNVKVREPTNLIKEPATSSPVLHCLALCYNVLQCVVVWMSR